MKKDYQYPSVYELEEVLSNITNRKFLNKFAQSRGIFITNATSKELGKELSNYFWNEADLEEIRKEAYQLKSNHALSGFAITSDSKFNLKTTFENIREQGNFDKDLVLNSLVKVKDAEGNLYKGTVEYNKKKVGRIEFLQDESSSFDFYIREVDNKSWQVEVDGNRSTDLGMVRDIFKKNLPDTMVPEEILQDSLNTKNAILFLDRLAREGMDNEWTFVDVKHLTFRKGKEKRNVEDEMDDVEMDDVEEVQSEDLIGISQAILQGKNLRENPFVKDCEKSGYLFTAMTYEFENSKTPHIIQIKAEFKGRPKVFEVSITSVEENIGLKSLRRLSSLTEKENMAIRSSFWNNAKTIYNDLI